MQESAGRHSSGQVQHAIFAGGPARRRLVRAAAVCGFGLLGAWLIALILGVFGGVGSLPLLPGPAHSDNTSKLSSTDRMAQPGPAPTHSRDAAAEAPPTSGGG